VWVWVWGWGGGGGARGRAFVRIFTLICKNEGRGVYYFLFAHRHLTWTVRTHVL
jgi:hypothetical protein